MIERPPEHIRASFPIILSANCFDSNLYPHNIMCFFVHSEVAFLHPTSFSFHASTCSLVACLEIIVNRLNMFAFANPTCIRLLMDMLCFYKLND
jgi:hypothetical protein